MRTNECSFFDGHTLRNKRKCLNLHIPSYLDLFSDLYEGTYFATIANLTPIEIDKVRVRNNHILTQLNIVRNHRYTARGGKSLMILSLIN